jgi:hypothetical protein
MLFIGGSKCGKTTACLSMVQHLAFNTLQVIAKYWKTDEDWQEFHRQIQEREDEDGEEASIWSSDVHDLIPVDKLNKKNRNLILIDDMMLLSKNDKKDIVECYTSGRHTETSICYLMQSYTGIDPAARGSTDYVAVFRGSTPEHLKQIWEHYAGELDWKFFKQLYHSCISIPHGFLYIDRYNPNVALRYRRKFDELLIPSNVSLSALQKELELARAKPSKGKAKKVESSSDEENAD